jgi:hypothetical protein
MVATNVSYHSFKQEEVADMVLASIVTGGLLFFCFLLMFLFRILLTLINISIYIDKTRK